MDIWLIPLPPQMSTWFMDDTVVVTIPTGQQPRNFRIEPKRQKTRETINGVPLFHGFLKTIGSPLSLLGFVISRTFMDFLKSIF